MSHHFDTPTAKEDPRINICDFYLFDGAPGTTVMAMTVNPDAARLAPDTFRDEGIYAFRFDLNGDSREEVTFKVRFGEVGHAGVTSICTCNRCNSGRATGAEAIRGAGGEFLLEGKTGQVVQKSGIRVYARLAPDLFAGDAVAILHFMASFYKDNRYDPDAFQHRQNYFDKRNVSRDCGRGSKPSDRQRHGSRVDDCLPLRACSGGAGLALGLAIGHPCLSG